MNQNMPYFGLHSSTKLVALARSRMHVNLIDIETGTIEAYFKAGEDRFLNSLLVSGNGRYVYKLLNYYYQTLMQFICFFLNLLLHNSFLSIFFKYLTYRI